MAQTCEAFVPHTKKFRGEWAKNVGLLGSPRYLVLAAYLLLTTSLGVVLICMAKAGSHHRILNKQERGCGGQADPFLQKCLPFASEAKYIHTIRPRNSTPGCIYTRWKWVLNVHNKEARHKRPRITWACLHEMSRIDKFTETEGRLVVARGWRSDC